MKILVSVFIFLLSLICTSLSCQSRIIRGKAIGSDFPDKENIKEHEFWALNNALILGNDSIRLGAANDTGEFYVEVSPDIQNLSIAWVGMYPEKIELSNHCDFFEIILLPDVIYDFVTVKKEERLRKKDRKVLPELYRLAFEQGIFAREIPCR